MKTLVFSIFAIAMVCLGIRLGTDYQAPAWPEREVFPEREKAENYVWNPSESPLVIPNDKERRILLLGGALLRVPSPFAKSLATKLSDAGLKNFDLVDFSDFDGLLSNAYFRWESAGKFLGSSDVVVFVNPNTFHFSEMISLNWKKTLQAPYPQMSLAGKFLPGLNWLLTKSRSKRVHIPAPDDQALIDEIVSLSGEDRVKALVKHLKSHEYYFPGVPDTNLEYPIRKASPEFWSYFDSSTGMASAKLANWLLKNWIDGDVFRLENLVDSADQVKVPEELLTKAESDMTQFHKSVTETGARVWFVIETTMAADPIVANFWRPARGFMLPQYNDLALARALYNQVKNKGWNVLSLDEMLAGRSDYYIRDAGLLKPEVLDEIATRLAKDLQSVQK